jgi:CMP-2-keto-3-deoxyoctulosonic acid synthetase
MTQRTLLKKDIIQHINTPHIVGALMGIYGCGERTIQRYFEANSPELTQYDALEAISKYTGINIKNLLAKEEVAATN